MRRAALLIIFFFLTVILAGGCATTESKYPYQELNYEKDFKYSVLKGLSLTPDIEEKILALDRLFNAVLCLNLVRNLAEIFYNAEEVVKFPELGRGDEIGIKTNFIVLSP